LGLTAFFYFLFNIIIGAITFFYFKKQTVKDYFGIPESGKIPDEEINKAKTAIEKYASLGKAIITIGGIIIVSIIILSNTILFDFFAVNYAFSMLGGLLVAFIFCMGVIFYSYYISLHKSLRSVGIFIASLILFIYFIFGYVVHGRIIDGFNGLVPLSWDLYNDGTFVMKVNNRLPYEVNVTGIDLGLRNGKIPCTSIRLNGKDVTQVSDPVSSSQYENGTYEIDLPKDFAKLPSNQLIQSGESFTVEANCNMELGTYPEIVLSGYYILTGYNMQANIHCINLDVAKKEHRMGSGTQGNLQGSISLIKHDSKGISLPRYDGKNARECDRDYDCESLEFGNIGNWSVGCCLSKCNLETHECYTGSPNNISCKIDEVCKEDCKCYYMPPGVEVEVRAQDNNCQFEVPSYNFSCYDTIQGGLSVKYYRNNILYESGPYYHNFTVTADFNSTITLTAHSLDKYSWHEWDDFGCGRYSSNPISILIDRCIPNEFTKKILVAYYSQV
jgi:energy-coupling factor transporter transmembrane protein EcfT